MCVFNSTSSNSCETIDEEGFESEGGESVGEASGASDFVGEGESEGFEGAGFEDGMSGFSALFDKVGRLVGFEGEGSPSSSSSPPPVFVGFGEFDEPVTGFVVPAPVVTVWVVTDWNSLISSDDVLGE